ncbi:NAD(P)-binding domain-containing protein [Natribacillus halophilus]|uniref:D-isomer specific 2-hydroxyacid dehydrogenase, NAD binding domain n=1 Tax=Natribacillus halophilus TaxID=549003 RepID=A0A1G8R8V5_9BACI|nr:NAD(P)-binding domain-containing protein [Natribacillus halophilus]SDJ13391.1 D-isomer specific 2-hydroxyacid dehydrogenase, NAD binding domain [Natribacillus halophilus]
MITCGLVGVGQLGAALARQLEGESVHIRAYHPNSQKATEFARRFYKVRAVELAELFGQSTILLALPADGIIPFLKNAQKTIQNDVQPTFVNLSTLVDTKELQKEFPDLQIYGVKIIGHANDLYEHGEGLFVSEPPLDAEGFREVRFLFDKIGTLLEDKEDVVAEVNRLAVRKTLEACISFEKEAGAKNYPETYSKKAMDTIFPHIIEHYKEGTLEGFALQVLNEINAENKK